MRNLNFDTGRVSYEVNGVPNAVSFNPTDMDFVDNLLKFYEEFSSKYDAMSKAIQEAGDNRGVFDVFTKMETEINHGINSLFGDKAAENLFPDVGCCAMASGLPVWMNFILAVMEEIQDACKAQEKALPTRLQQIMSKYQK